jgi:hypothetical protein
MYAGFMAAQMVHLETLQGVAWLTWVAVALYHTAAAKTWQVRTRWTVALGVFGGLVILVGSPEPMAYGAIFAVVLAGFFVFDPAQRAGPVVLSYAVAAALALMLGGAQWIPGEAFIHLSQRAHASFQFFTSMSLSPSDAVLVLFPYILGGYNRFLEPMYYMGRFNLPEISSYVGLLPVFAAIRLLPWWRGIKKYRGLTIFYVLALVGAVLALGKYTPVSHLFYHIPVLNGIRAQNRNLFMVDFALSALFAFWFDEEVRGWVRQESRSLRDYAPWGVFTLLYLVVGGLGLLEAAPPVLAHIAPYLVETVLLGIVAVGGIFMLPRFPQRYRILFFTVFTLIDVGLYDGGQYWMNVPKASVATGNGALAAPAQMIADSSGRVGIYDPLLYRYRQMDSIGQPDLNILTGLTSFQGYGSLVSSQYNQVTGAHLQGTFSPRVLRAGTADDLNISTVFAVPEAFTQSVEPGWKAPADARLAPASAQDPWFFGQVLAVSQVTLDLALPAPASISGVWQVGTISLHSTRIVWLSVHAIVLGDHIILSLPPYHPTMTALAVRPPHGPVPVLRAATVTAYAPGGSRMRTYRIYGALQQAMAFPEWQFSGMLGEFGVFHNRGRHGQVWLKGGTSHGTASVVQSPLQGQQTVEVDARRSSELIWSETYQPGWTATVYGQHRKVQVPVRAYGVVQEIRVPKGRYRIVFRYRPSSVILGIEASALGIIMALATGLILGLERLRRGRSE